MNVYNTALGPGVGLDDADSEILQYGALVKGNPGGNTGIFMAKISTISSTTLATTLLSGTLNGTFDEGVLLLGCGGGWNMAGYAQDFGPQFIINGLPDNTNSSNVISGHFGYGIGINGGANVYNNAPTETGDLVFSNDGGTTYDSMTVNLSPNPHTLVPSNMVPSGLTISSGGCAYIIFVPSSWLSKSALGIDTIYNLDNVSSADDATSVANWAAACPGIRNITTDPTVQKNLYDLIYKYVNNGAIAKVNSSNSTSDFSVFYELIPMPALSFTAGASVTMNIVFDPTTTARYTTSESSLLFNPQPALGVSGNPVLNFSITVQ
jgi:hypothetical protein